MWRIFKTAEFDSDFERLDESERIRVKKVLNQIIEKGNEIGKPLSGLRFFKEKKLNGKRLYFLVYLDFKTILILGISTKKAQQRTINEILVKLSEYKTFIDKKVKEI